MNSVLVHIAVAVGFVVFLIALAIGLIQEVPLLSALYRALMIMVLSSVVVTLFFQFFARVLYGFIAEQQRANAAEAEKQEADKKAKQQSPQARPAERGK